jgi:hypothetical protein
MWPKCGQNAPDWVLQELALMLELRGIAALRKVKLFG